MPGTEIFHVTIDHVGTRIDRFIEAQHLTGLPSQNLLSRTYIQKIIRDGAVTVNGKISKPGYKIRECDRIILTLPDSQPLETIQSETIPLHIIHEDSSVIVLNKAAGMLVHPSNRVNSGTLVNALLAHCDDLSGIGGVERPGIVHRLDKGTSGVLVVAKTDRAHQSLSAQFEAHTTTRRYVTVVCGIPEPGTGTIDERIARSHRDRRKMSVVKANGRYAVTHYHMLESYEQFALLQVALETGRLHQVRVHLSHIGHPVVGDGVYGGGQERALANALAVTVQQALTKLDRQALHAETLGFNHPETGERREFSVAMPGDMRRIVDALRGEKIK